MVYYQQLSTAFQKYTRPEHALAKYTPNLFNESDIKLTQIAKYCISLVEQQFVQGRFSAKLPECIYATSTELNVLRSCLLHQFGILTGAYTKDREEKVQKEVKPSYGPASAETVTKNYEHDCTDQIVIMKDEMGWNIGKDEQECWQLSLSCFTNDQGPLYCQEERTYTPRQIVYQEVRSYTDELAKVDSFIKENQPFYEMWIQCQVEHLKGNMEQFFQFDPTDSNKYTSLKCVYGTTHEMEILKKNMLAEHLQIDVKKKGQHLHRIAERPFRLLEVFGYLRRDLHEDSCYVFHVVVHRNPMSQIPKPMFQIAPLQNDAGQQSNSHLQLTFPMN